MNGRDAQEYEESARNMLSGELCERDTLINDLLAALESIATGFDGQQNYSGTDCRKIARTAIAKAKGDA